MPFSKPSRADEAAVLDVEAAAVMMGGIRLLFRRGISPFVRPASRRVDRGRSLKKRNETVSVKGSPFAGSRPMSDVNDATVGRSRRLRALHGIVVAVALVVSP